jgi:FdhD protein
MSRNGTHQSVKHLSSATPVVAHSKPVAYLEYQGDEVSCASKPMVIESAWPLIVNGQYWLTVLCTPTKLDYFVLGFLYNEGLISGPADVLDLHIGQPPEAVIRVQLEDRDLRLPEHRTLTSGCGGGITFIDLAAAREPVHSALQVSPRQISDMMARLMATVADDYRRVGGFHTAGLSDGHQLPIIATDIGRHNTLDKVAGECLSRNIPMQDAILLTTGRVSVEMLGKAARMKVPVVATLNSPTHLAVELARQWDITLIGYARGARMHVYTGWQRVHTVSAVAYAEEANDCCKGLIEVEEGE